MAGTGGENRRPSGRHEVRVVRKLGDSIRIGRRKRHGAARVWIVDGAVGKADYVNIGRRDIVVRKIVQNFPWFRNTIRVIGSDMVTKPGFTRAALC